MKRLTFDGNFCDIAKCGEINGGSSCKDGYCSQRKVWERLKEYEDTGLSPEICLNYKIFEDEAISKSVTFNRIVELMDAEAEGRLVVLPCKVGDTVFCIPAMGKEIIEDIVEDADIWSIKDGIKVRLTLKTFKDYVVGEFGKTIFRTLEEAEQALKGECK